LHAAKRLDALTSEINGLLDYTAGEIKNKRGKIFLTPQRKGEKMTVRVKRDVQTIKRFNVHSNA